MRDPEFIELTKLTSDYSKSLSHENISFTDRVLYILRIIKGSR